MKTKILRLKMILLKSLENAVFELYIFFNNSFNLYNNKDKRYRIVYSSHTFPLNLIFFSFVLVINIYIFFGRFLFKIKFINLELLKK